MIKVLKTTYKDIGKFNRKEWDEADKEHYGKVYDWGRVWKKKKIVLKAAEHGKTVGVLRFEIEGMVAFIDTIIVAKASRQRGIGKKLMQAAEEKAKKLDCHKIWLETGKEWSAISLYEALGYEKVADLPKHYVKKDFILLAKFI